ncbi:MAG: HlyD family efflux transporter periplasmic adaptor subunit [Pseudohongiella sp.]|nr:HlyD family efflux transporter periplasmic adaptor subunit [Pseudohongiella sp.]MDP2125971.1 HlyD family efflux transporter periplasmic adaptor subunit [Pseudohongiella sp.]
MKITRLTLVVLMLLTLSACEQENSGWYGIVERERHSLSAPVSELITDVLVREGDQVRAGQVLLRLDDSSVQARITQREAELAELHAVREELTQGPRGEAIARAESAVQGAQADVLDAEQRLQRAQQLVRSGAGTQAEADQTLSVRDQAVARVEQARQQLAELRNGTRPEQLLQIDARIAAAAARLALEQKALQDLSLVSAHDAVVDSLPWQLGDRVAQGAPLISLLIDQQAYVRVYVPADARDRLPPGTQLMVQPDSDIPAFPANIRYIRAQPAFTPFYALNERDRARLMYLTELSLPEPQSGLPTGMTVEVRLP